MSEWIKRLAEKYSEVNEKKLTGNQHKLDMDKDGDIDGDDFKHMRNKKKTNEDEVVMNPKKEKKEKETMAAEAKIDEISMDKAKSAYVRRKSQAQGAAAQGSMDYAKKQMAKARKTKAYMDKRESVDEAVDLEMHKKAAASHAAKAKPVGKRWPKGAEQHDNAARAHQHVINMHKKFGADHDGTKDAIKAAKAASQKASGMKESTLPPVYARIMEERAKHYKGATKPEDWDEKEKNNKGAMDMKKDMKSGGEEAPYKERDGHDDASKAGRVTGSAKTRPGDNAKGDKNIINPVKGVVTKET